MKLSKVGAESYPNSQNLKEEIKMTLKKFSRRIGAALAISVAVWLVIGIVSETVTYAQGFVLNPSSGSATRGGQTRFQAIGINPWMAIPPAVPPTYDCTLLTAAPPDGVSVSFAPPVVTLVPFGGQGLSQATVTIGSTITLGTYQLNVIANCIRVVGTVGPPTVSIPLVYRLQVQSNGDNSSPGPGQVRLVATPNPARLGETITFRLTNEGSSTLQLPSTAPWRIVNAANQAVFATVAAQVVTNVGSNQTLSWAWDQRDQAGNPVPAGDYTIILSTLNGDPRELSARFTIQGGIGPSPNPANRLTIQTDSRFYIAGVAERVIVSGQLTGPDGRPIANAEYRYTVRDPRGREGALGCGPVPSGALVHRTNQQGNILLSCYEWLGTRAIPGTYTLTLTALGATASVNIEFLARQLDVSAQISPNTSTRPGGTVTLSGRVRRSGSAVGNIPVQVQLISYIESGYYLIWLTMTVTTDANGNYRANVVIPQNVVPVPGNLSFMIRARIPNAVEGGLNRGTSIRVIR